MDSEGSLDDHALTRLVGSYRWLEKQLFHLLGGWTTSVTQASIKIFLDEQSFEYAWHAELWADRLPDPERLAPAGLTAPPNRGVAALFHELAEAGSSLTTVEKLVSVYRVIVPRLVTAYSSHLHQAEGTDSTQRALRLIVADELSAWRAGEGHVQSLLVDENAIVRASDQQHRVELLIVQAGGLVNLEV